MIDNVEKTDDEIAANAAAFAEAARRYCDFAESKPGDGHAEMAVIQRLLAELNWKVQSLPADVFGEDKIEREKFSTEARKTVRERFEKLPVTGFWRIFDSSNADEDQPVFGVLSDDLADIYGDLKRGLNLYDAGYLEDAIWEWKFQYNSHWGRHLLDAQKAIYSWKCEKGDDT